MEIANKTISVWLQMADGANAGKFALQKRPQSEKHFPFVCQATWAGKVESGETAEEAIKRECEEEMGARFKNNFDFSALKFVSKDKFAMKGSDWESYNYTGRISAEELQTAELHSDAEQDFIFVGKNDMFYAIESAKNPKIEIVLFNDQYKVFKKINGD